MIPFIVTALSNRWVRYGIAAVAVLFLCLAIRKHYIDQGKDQGREEQKQDSKAEVEKTREAERAQAATAIAAKDAEAKAAGARAEAYEQAASQFAELNRTLIAQRAAIVTKVNATPDSELHAGITGALGIRPPTDLAPGYYPTEERAIYSCVLERPGCAKQAEANAGEIQKHTAAIAEMKTQITALDGKYDALAGYTTALEGHYTTLANLWPAKTRAARCVFLWKCKVNKLPVPNPADLRKARPAQ